MICVLKHKKTGKYITAALGKLTRQMIWDGNKNIVQFHLTDNLLQARQVEDPNMDMVNAYGLEAVPIKLTQAVLERDGRIFEHGD
jgi:hypothetical protein